MAKITIGDYTIVTSLRGVMVSSGTNSISFTPAEIEKAEKLLVMAMQTISMEALPPQLKSKPFIVYFSADGVFALSRQEDPDQSVTFTFDSGDELIDALVVGRQKLVDELRISGGAKAGVSSYNPPDPAFDGR